MCAALVGQGREARARGDYSAETDANVEIRNHPHRRRGRPRRHRGEEGGEGASRGPLPGGDGARDAVAAGNRVARASAAGQVGAAVLGGHAVAVRTGGAQSWASHRSGPNTS